MLIFLKGKYVIKACLNKTALIYLFIYLSNYLPSSLSWLSLAVLDTSWIHLGDLAGNLCLVALAVLAPVCNQTLLAAVPTRCLLHLALPRCLLPRVDAVLQIPSLKRNKGKELPVSENNRGTASTPQGRKKKLIGILCMLFGAAFCCSCYPQSTNPLIIPVCSHIYSVAVKEKAQEREKKYFSCPTVRSDLD